MLVFFFGNAFEGWIVQKLFLTWFFIAVKVKETKNHIDVFFQWLSTETFSGFSTG